jgi:pimeloyl-ACP methyl ester carboxylesterase
MTKLLKVCCLTLTLAVVSLPGPVHAQERAPSQAPNDSDYQKFEAWRTFLANRTAQTFAITGSNHIDESAYVKIGGIDHWITIRGEDRNNPVILFLHGGPGDVTNPWAYPYFLSWLKHFTVVQWDQRGAGKTLRATGESIGPTMTIERMTQDGIELTEYLRQHLRKNKIIVVGHSWGSVFGVLMAKARPDLFHAFVGTGQVADFKQSDVVAYKLALQTAGVAGEPSDVASLKAIGIPPYADGKAWQLFGKWRRKCEGAETDKFLGGLMGFAFQSPGYSIRDINDWLDGQVLGGEKLIGQGAKLSPKRLAGEFELPVFVFQGEHDCSSPTELARNYVDSINAPKKEFVAIPGAGHFAVFMKSNEFLMELVARVRPLATLKK